MVREFQDPGDQEIVGLLASSLALGRVNSILKTLRRVLRNFSEPRRELLALDEGEIARRCKGFVYRFYAESDLVDLLLGIRRCVSDFGSLNGAFLSEAQDEPLTRRLERFVSLLQPQGGKLKMIAAPTGGSCCKRLHLYLRWMVRSDAVDPGCWSDVDPAKLLVPVDTHMLKVSRILGFTQRVRPDAKATMEITSAFREIRREDPVKYDFCLTRIGIHPTLDYLTVFGREHALLKLPKD